jgi:hypothetical protein
MSVQMLVEIYMKFMKILLVVFKLLYEERVRDRHGESNKQIIFCECAKTG